MPVISCTHDLESLTLTFVAEFAVPVQRIWDLYADPRQLEKVWGPPSHPATFARHDFEVGGRSHYYMTGPEGQKYCGYWVMTLMEEPTRFCYEDGFCDEKFSPNPDLPVSINDYTFEMIESGTRATYLSTYASKEGLEQVLAMGVVEGATSAINQIDAFLSN